MGLLFGYGETKVIIFTNYLVIGTMGSAIHDIGTHSSQKKHSWRSSSGIFEKNFGAITVVITAEPMPKKEAVVPICNEGELPVLLGGLPGGFST
jgi:hypothetical protein